MANKKEYESILKAYEEEGKSLGKSLVDYCLESGVDFDKFQRWYLKYSNGIQIIPLRDVNEAESDSAQPGPSSEVSSMSITLRSGVRVSVRDLSLSDASSIVTKLASLC